ncbi:lachesin-like [Uloborus diversus]|uniref:lachesin-like n=1 Tax=Uloborus diversus TaxID=327109 RepID=UPI002408F8E4|nr:lachesin-like [Uloborus diversus]
MQLRRVNMREMDLYLVIPAILVVFSLSVASLEPEFTETIPNVTVPIGRDALLRCTVENLGSYKVAWIKMDTQTLLSIHKNVITRDQRIRVTHNNMQWNLHIKEVDKKDRGYYMCQINTQPMVSERGYLDVMVPPTIIESRTSSDTVVEEQKRVSLRCEAYGYPQPKVTWRREDGNKIHLGSYGGRKFTALRVEGEYLNISQVSREDMGAYLCIAANGVPPSVSKRIMLQVNFRPKIRVPRQLIGAATGVDVVLECKLEASPTPLTSWIRHDGLMLLNNKKYHLEEDRDGYKIHMRIRIGNLRENDFGSYKCVAKNTLGEKEGFIRLYENKRIGSSLENNMLATNTQMDESQEHLSGAFLKRWMNLWFIVLLTGILLLNSFVS